MKRATTTIAAFAAAACNPNLAPAPYGDPAEDNDYCQRDGAGRLVVTITNDAQMPSPASSAAVEFEISNGILTAVEPTPFLDAEMSAELVFDVPADCWRPDCAFTIYADALDNVLELNEADNVVSGWCEG